MLKYTKQNQFTMLTYSMQTNTKLKQSAILKLQ